MSNGKPKANRQSKPGQLANEKRGRPKWQPPDLEVIEKLASRGLTEAQVAAALGISQDTLIARKKDFVGFSEALKRGKAAGLWEISNALYAEACQGSVSAAIFYLKCRDPQNWNDRYFQNQHQELPAVNPKHTE